MKVIIFVASAEEQKLTIVTCRELEDGTEVMHNLDDTPETKLARMVLEKMDCLTCLLPCKSNGLGLQTVSVPVILTHYSLIFAKTRLAAEPLNRWGAIPHGGFIKSLQGSPLWKDPFRDPSVFLYLRVSLLI